MVLGVMVLLVTPVTWWPPRIGRQAFVRILHLCDASGHRLPPAACRLLRHVRAEGQSTLPTTGDKIPRNARSSVLCCHPLPYSFAMPATHATARRHTWRT